MYYTFYWWKNVENKSNGAVVCKIGITWLRFWQRFSIWFMGKLINGFFICIYTYINIDRPNIDSATKNYFIPWMNILFFLISRWTRLTSRVILTISYTMQIQRTTFIACIDQCAVHPFPFWMQNVCFGGILYLSLWINVSCFLHPCKKTYSD